MREEAGGLAGKDNRSSSRSCLVQVFTVVLQFQLQVSLVIREA